MDGITLKGKKIDVSEMSRLETLRENYKKLLSEKKETEREYKLREEHLQLAINTQMVYEAQNEIQDIGSNFTMGLITHREWANQVTDTVNRITRDLHVVVGDKS